MAVSANTLQTHLHLPGLHPMALSAAAPPALPWAGGPQGLSLQRPVTKHQLTNKTHLCAFCLQKRQNNSSYFNPQGNSRTIFLIQWCLESYFSMTCNLMRKDSAKLHLHLHSRFAPIINIPVISIDLLITL